MSNPDQHCSSCAYRVNDKRRFGSVFGYTMVCLHPSVGRDDCQNARRNNGACGQEAALWVRHAERVGVAK